MKNEKKGGGNSSAFKATKSRGSKLVVKGGQKVR